MCLILSALYLSRCYVVSVYAGQVNINKDTQMAPPVRFTGEGTVDSVLNQ
jgi:hypothetical protein